MSTRELLHDCIISRHCACAASSLPGCVHKGTNHIPKDVSGSRSASWLRSWFTLRALTCTGNVFPITIRICALRGNILFPLHSPALIDPCMASARISKMHMHESRSDRALRSHVLELGFLRGSRSKMPLFSHFKSAFQKPDLKELCVHKGKKKSGFKIRKGPNHVPKCLSERDSFSCEQALCLLPKLLTRSPWFPHRPRSWIPFTIKIKVG